MARPLSARSVIASLLLRTTPPRMHGRRLVQWCELFGIAEGTARVALSRMVERGELTARDGVYELAGRVRDRAPAQDFSVAPHLRPWRGDWRTALIASGARSVDDRAALRHAMRGLRYAELRDGVWTRPDNLPDEASTPDAWSVAREQCSWWTSRPDDEPVKLAAKLFSPHEWAAHARLLIDALDAAIDDVESNDDQAIADAFVAGAAAIAHLRADPLMPAELCPRPWPGSLLRKSYLRYERSFSAAVRAWFHSH
jgi:phenylacetic acid degradation operon negative regulatory protein